MAELEYRGDALAVAQISTITLAGVYADAVTLTVTINRKAVAYTTQVADSDFDDAAAGLVAALQAAQSSIPEFNEILWTVAGAVITGTANPAGVPFEFSVATSGSITITPATPTVSKGPLHWDDVNNWSTLAIPVNSDRVILSRNASVAYGVNQSAVTLADISTPVDYTGSMGLPRINALGYYEYRKTFVEVGATTVNLRGAPGRIKLALGTPVTNISVQCSSTTSNGERSVQITATNTDNVLKVLQGSVAIAGDPFATSEFDIIQTGSINSPTTDADILLGPGCVLNEVLASGGNVAVNSDTALIFIKDGVVTVYGEAETTLVNGQGGTMFWQSSGELTASLLGTDFMLDFSRDPRERTLGACDMSANSGLNDPFGTVTLTTPIRLVGCRISELKLLDLGSNITIDRALIA
jgi:hypothetical protein